MNQISQIINVLNDSRPISIIGLVELLQQSEGKQNFIHLTKRYLPNYEAEIMAAGSKKIEVFLKYWSDQYFPVNECYLEMMDEREDRYQFFAGEIPIPIMGISFDDYHEIPNWDDMDCLTISLFESPWQCVGDNDRIPMLERSAEIVGDKIIRRLPKDGYNLDDITIWLTGTPYQPLIYIGEWVYQSTGNTFWDVTYDEECYDCLWDDDGVIQNLALQWKDAIRIREVISKFQSWVAQDPKSRITEIIDAIELAKSTAQNKPKTLVNILGRDQSTEIPKLLSEL